MAAANDNYEKAFQNVPSIDNIEEIEERIDNVNDNNDNNLEETETFGLDLLPVVVVVDEEELLIKKEDDNDDTSIYDNYDHNVGFVLADVYDVEKIIELSNMNLKEAHKQEPESTDDSI